MIDSSTSPPSQAANIASIIEDHDPDRTALIDGDRRVTYGELVERVSAARSVLAGAGLGPNRRLGILAGNEVDFAVAGLAGLGLGAQVIPLAPNSPIPETSRKLAAAGPDLLVLGEMAGWMRDDGTDLGVDVVPLDSAVGSGAPAIVPVDEDHLAFLMLTSGVTSDSKVAMLSHGNLTWAQKVLVDGGPLGLGPDDVCLGVLPFSHIFGLNVVLLATLRAGGTVVMQRRFDAAESLRLVREHSVTALSGAPPMWKRWAEAEGPDDSFATIDHASSGAAALPAEVSAAVSARFGVDVGEGYGLTETSPLVSMSRGITIKPTSVGQVVTGAEVLLVDPDGTPVDTGDTGEVVVRSPGVFKGYLDAPELTEAVLTHDGWFWTGDVGVFDDDDYLYLVDRVKDLVIVSGFNVYPAEVENVLMAHPDVRGVVVTGAAHVDTGETVVAHVLGTASAADLDVWARANLSRYKCPTEYRFVDELPIAATGKLIRRELR